MAPVSRELLLRRWVHSHEEDTDTEMVFRPEGFDFPRSRGRVAFELREDGTATDRGIGATDVPEETEGSWRLEGEGTVVLLERGTDRVVRRLSVNSLGPDRLAVRRSDLAE